MYFRVSWIFKPEAPCGASCVQLLQTAQTFAQVLLTNRTSSSTFPLDGAIICYLKLSSSICIFDKASAQGENRAKCVLKGKSKVIGLHNYINPQPFISEVKMNVGGIETFSRISQVLLPNTHTPNEFLWWREFYWAIIRDTDRRAYIIQLFMKLPGHGGRSVKH